MATPCAAIILIFAVSAVFAPLLAPYSLREQRSSEALQTPNRQHLLGMDNRCTQISGKIDFNSICVYLRSIGVHLRSVS